MNTVQKNVINKILSSGIGRAFLFCLFCFTIYVFLYLLFIDRIDGGKNCFAFLTRWECSMKKAQFKFRRRDRCERGEEGGGGVCGTTLG